jgi:hypothetical protein
MLASTKPLICLLTGHNTVLPVCKINVEIVQVEVLLCQLVVLKLAECKYQPMLKRCNFTGLGIPTHCIDNTLFFSWLCNFPTGSNKKLKKASPLYNVEI